MILRSPVESKTYLPAEKRIPQRSKRGAGGRPKRITSVYHLDNVAELLTVGIRRAQAHLKVRNDGKSSTGLGPEIERVLTPEGGT